MNIYERGLQIRNVSGMTQEEIRQLRLNIKKANQRLTELEKTGLDKYSSAYDKYSSGNFPFIHEVEKGQTGKVGLKFTTSLTGLTTQEIKQLNYHVKHFLSMQTSTVGGVKKHYEDMRKLYADEDYEEDDYDFFDDDLNDIINNDERSMTYGEYYYYMMKEYGLEGLTKEEAFQNATREESDLLLDNLRKIKNVDHGVAYLNYVHSLGTEDEEKARQELMKYEE